MSFSIDLAPIRRAAHSGSCRLCRAAWQRLRPSGFAIENAEQAMGQRRVAATKAGTTRTPNPLALQIVTMEADMPTEFDPNLDPTANRMGSTGQTTARGGNGGLIAGIIVVLIVVVGIFALRGNFGQMEGRSVSTAPSSSAPATTSIAPSAPATPAPAPAAPTAPANP
jgi:hypothetical protein